jgi:hypothetical protein
MWTDASRWITVFPLHDLRGFIVLTDAAHQFFGEVPDRGEDAAGDDITLDLGEPQFDLIEP